MLQTWTSRYGLRVSAPVSDLLHMFLGNRVEHVSVCVPYILFRFRFCAVPFVLRVFRRDVLDFIVEIIFYQINVSLSRKEIMMSLLDLLRSLAENPGCVKSRNFRPIGFPRLESSTSAMILRNIWMFLFASACPSNNACSGEKIICDT